MEVAEVMSRNVVTVAPETPLTEAARLMATHSIGSLPVVDDTAQIVGIITESDIFRAFADLASEAREVGDAG
jgi:acetoin utilization protein AcuB